VKDKIIALLVEHGELPLNKVVIPYVSPKTVSSNLTRMFESGVLTRRRVNSRWAYSVKDHEPCYLNGEPSYAYYLRNLPRNKDDRLHLSATNGPTRVESSIRSYAKP